ncbi:MAG: type II secretion system F family protein [Rickettsiales bacterium]|jgi:tight adherence protein B|nr:type II secretion system F family protein [Rickettsiales bacterium]
MEIAIAIAVGVAAYVLMVAILPKRLMNESSYTQNMLRKLEEEAALGLRVAEEVTLFRDQAYATSGFTRIFLRFPGAQIIYPRLLKAGLAYSLEKFVMISVLSFILLLFVLSKGGFMGILSALSLTLLGAWMYINRRIRLRNQAFVAAFPDALDTIVRSVRSGYPLNTAIKMVADNMPAPVSTEFKQVVDETSYGSSLIESLKRLTQRIDEPDIRFFVVVLTVQQEVGGNLAEVLSNLSSIIRKRKNLYLKIKALSSEGRATAWVLGLLPLFEFVMIYMVAPHHLTPLFTTAMGNMILAGAVGMVLLGVFIVRQMINIEV